MDKFFTGLGISLILFGSLLVFQRNNPNRVAFAKSENNVLITNEVKEITPRFISIPSLNIDLEIYPSEIKNNKWEVTDKGVSYLQTSVVPGEYGNSILYGHNWTNLLGKLTKVNIGDTVEITFDDMSKKVFTVVLIQEVDPDDVSILKNTSDKRITIYTCSGFLDTKRFVVVAILK